MRKFKLIGYLCAGALVIWSFKSPKWLQVVQTDQKICLSAEEVKLYQEICQYRTSRHLDSVPLSAALCKTAMAHTLDLRLNAPDQKPCNLHSWSSKGAWDPCCYRGGKEGPCMWKKPYEIAGFVADGFEIASWTSGQMTSKTALDLWKQSPGHNAVICNTGIWNKMTWKSMGVSVYGHYAVVWFAAEKDSAPIPEECEN